MPEQVVRDDNNEGLLCKGLVILHGHLQGNQILGSLPLHELWWPAQHHSAAGLPAQRCFHP